ncbi:MAG TPA: hypothetical protein VGV59_05765 [Pyrinomonadaceae bacterium]|nr:hypothetical protein [Pyrinomonadaceae bacterium]
MEVLDGGSLGFVEAWEEKWEVSYMDGGDARQGVGYAMTIIARDVGSLRLSGGGIGAGLGVLTLLRPENLGGEQDRRTTCQRMADDAQKIADQILYDQRNMYSRVSPAESLKLFNMSFGTVTFGSYFTGSPFGFAGAQASGRNNVLGRREYQGQDGFATKFHDKSETTPTTPNPDQVHHFGAYFSAGIAGHKLIPDQHRADDRKAGHMGDVRLADQARTLGDYLRRNAAELKNIRQLIYDTICEGKDVPK